MSPILTTLPSTDPGRILHLRDRQYAAELIATALLHLDLFSWLHKHPDATSADIAAHFDLAARPLDVLLTLCRANGFIESTPADQHRLTTLGREHLVRDSPWFLGPYYKPISDTPVVQSYLQVLHTGKPAHWQAKDDTHDWHESMKDPAFAQDFTNLMNCRGLLFGQALAKSLQPLLSDKHHLLDIGGGSGIYASTLVAANPQLSATVLEQAPVDAIAREEITRHGLQHRIKVLSADMFTDPWPAADVILLSNLLHDWDLPEARQLVEKAAAALPTNGLLVIHGAFLHDDKTGPIPVAEYSALLMNITQGKCYSHAEYSTLLDGLHFNIAPYHPTVANRGFMTAIKQQ